MNVRNVMSGMVPSLWDVCVPYTHFIESSKLPQDDCLSCILWNGHVVFLAISREAVWFAVCSSAFRECAVADLGPAQGDRFKNEQIWGTRILAPARYSLLHAVS